MGSDHFFQGLFQRCHVISISLAALLQGRRERGKEGEAEGALLPKGGRQPTTTADSSRSAQEGGVGVSARVFL